MIRKVSQNGKYTKVKSVQQEQAITLRGNTDDPHRSFFLTDHSRFADHARPDLVGGSALQTGSSTGPSVGEQVTHLPSWGGGGRAGGAGWVTHLPGHREVGQEHEGLGGEVR